MKLWPTSLFGRLLLLMSTGLLVAQLAGALIQSWDRQRTLGHTVSHELAQRIAAVYRVVDGQSTAQDRQRLARQLSTPGQQVGVAQDAPDSVSVDSILNNLPGHIRELLGKAVEIRSVQLPSLSRFAFDLHLRLSSGEWLRLHGGAPEGVFALPWDLLFNLGLMLMAVVILVAVAARYTVRPLIDLAKAAHALSTDLKNPPVPVTGPREVCDAARAFNTMQTRIRNGIEERERFLAAVSHDLKTPLTRLRLRTEMMTNSQLQGQFRTDVDDMLQLLDGTLDFLRGKVLDEATQPVDLIALVESLVEDYEGMGDVSLHAPESLEWPCRPKALKRALTNLIDNALKHGGQTRVVVHHDAKGVEIQVRDNGPGLPEHELQNVFEPFYRIEHSRSRDTGGTGLGLAIVRQIAQSHGGDVELSNLQSGGLVARLYLKKAPASSEQNCTSSCSKASIP